MYAPLQRRPDTLKPVNKAPRATVLRQRRRRAQSRGTLRPQLSAQSPGARDAALPPQAEANIRSVSGGRPLTSEQRAFFEPRFGADFGDVQIHTGPSADAAADLVGARAYTLGNHIVLGRSQALSEGETVRRVLAHELAHVVQQGAAPQLGGPLLGETGTPRVQTGSPSAGMAGHLLQRLPGDGMVPPGDCSWAKYLALRGSVETAKAVVSMLGACSARDNCLTLAIKIAAVSAEIAARVALDASCFRGGDTGHRRQVQDKINMMNRCYRFFSTQGCSPQLVAAMAVVVEAARAAIAATAAALAIAAVVALIAAIIALAEAIAALAAAAAEAAAATAAVAAVVALLVLLRDELSPGGSSGA